MQAKALKALDHPRLTVLNMDLGKEGSIDKVAGDVAKALQGAPLVALVNNAGAVSVRHTYTSPIFVTRGWAWRT